MPAQEQLPNDRVTASLCTAADQFAEAVRSGHEVMALVVLRKISMIFQRFCSLPQTGTKPLPAQEPHQDLRPSKDSPNLRASIENFKKALVAGDKAEALEQLCMFGIPRRMCSASDEIAYLSASGWRAGSDQMGELARMGKLAFWINEFAHAETYASEGLKLVSREKRVGAASGRAVHDLNMIAGLLAISRDQVGDAKHYLAASANIPTSEELQRLGPNVSLASELLERGQHETVAEYLNRWVGLWSTGQSILRKWISSVKEGRRPDFDPIHFSV